MEHHIGKFGKNSIIINELRGIKSFFFEQSYRYERSFDFG